MNIVIVGCGSISRTWLAAVREMPRVRIVGLVDVVEANARARATEFGLDNVVVGTDLGHTLASVRPDAVFNCTVPEAHKAVALEAFRHGCHVLGEKPLAASMAEAREMVAAAQKAGRIFAVVQNRRYDPRIRRLRALVESGAIGRLTTANSDFYLGAHFGGFRDRMPHVLLLDMAIHTFDAARFLTGADPVSVYCKEWNPAGSWYDRDASAIAVFEMSDGIVYVYRGSWCAEGLNTAWESDWRIVGDQGSAKWDGADCIEAEAVAAKGGFRYQLRHAPIPDTDTSTKVGGHAGVIREFVDCLETGAVPETAGTDNIKSLAMVFGAIESAETGRPVEITC